MATKPLVDTTWASQITTDGTSGNLNKREPTTAFKNFGQPEAQPIDRQSINYELDALDQWKDYFEEVTDDLISSTSGIGVYQIVTSSRTLELKRAYSVNTLTSNIDLTLPASILAGQPIKIYHLPLGSSNICRVVNNGYTLVNSNYSLTSGDNIILTEGFCLELIPRTTSIIDFKIVKGDD